MPRPRRQTAGPIQRRVRTGCKTCRQRKVKCDEGKPRCRNCTQRGLACDNGVQLKWEPEFASRGLAFGRQGRWAKHSHSAGASSLPPLASSASVLTDDAQWCGFPSVGSHHFINTLFSEYDEGAAVERRRRAGAQETVEWRTVVTSCDSPDCQALAPLGSGSPLSPLSPTSSLVLLPPGPAAYPAYPVPVPVPIPQPYGHAALSLPYTPSALPSLTHGDRALLDYYLRRLCPLTTPSRRRPSPFAYLLVPVLHVPGHEDIWRAVLALSARHRSVADPADPVWAKAAMTLRDGVLGALRRRLARVEADSSGGWDAQILVLMMFLCLYEIVDSCDHRWVIHLRASQDVIRQSRQVQEAVAGENRSNNNNSSSSSNNDALAPLTTFTERFFAFQDVISRPACENPPLFGQDYWDEAVTTAVSASTSTSTPIDSWMGCQPALVRVLCRIADLSRLKTRRAISAADFETEAAALEQELGDLRAPVENDNITSPDDDDLARAAELKRLAVVIYHCCALHSASPATPLVAALVTDILEGTAALVDAGCTAGLSFPLFVAAVELDPLDQPRFRRGTSSGTTNEHLLSGRRLVLETLAAMARSSLANVARTQAVIEKVWRMRDMAVDGGVGSSSHPGGDAAQDQPNSDWGTFVGPYSLNISLA